MLPTTTCTGSGQPCRLWPAEPPHTPHRSGGIFAAGILTRRSCLPDAQQCCNAEGGGSIKCKCTDGLLPCPYLPSSMSRETSGSMQRASTAWPSAPGCRASGMSAASMAAPLGARKLALQSRKWTLPCLCARANSLRGGTGGGGDVQAASEPASAGRRMQARAWCRKCACSPVAAQPNPAAWLTAAAG